MGVKFGQIQLLTAALAALERLKKSMYNVVSTLVPSFFDWIFFILTGNKYNHKMSSKYDRIPPLTAELAALECLGN